MVLDKRVALQAREGPVDTLELAISSGPSTSVTVWVAVGIRHERFGSGEGVDGGWRAAAPFGALDLTNRAHRPCAGWRSSAGVETRVVDTSVENRSRPTASQASATASPTQPV